MHLPTNRQRARQESLSFSQAHQAIFGFVAWAWGLAPFAGAPGRPPGCFCLTQNLGNSVLFPRLLHVPGRDHGEDVGDVDASVRGHVGMGLICVHQGETVRSVSIGYDVTSRWGEARAQPGQGCSGGLEVFLLYDRGAAEL